MVKDERELLLLGLLRRQEMHGYELGRFLKHRRGAPFDLNLSTAYFLLGRMEQRGLVQAEQQRAGRRPERRTYRLTEQGNAAFERGLREHLSSYVPARHADEVGLLFLDMLPPDEARRLLLTKRGAVEARLAAARERHTAHAAAPARWLTSHQLAHLQAEADWLAQTLEALQVADVPPGLVCEGEERSFAG